MDRLKEALDWFEACARAKSVQIFNSFAREFDSRFPDVYTYVMEVAPEKWASCMKLVGDHVVVSTNAVGECGVCSFAACSLCNRVNCSGCACALFTVFRGSLQRACTRQSRRISFSLDYVGAGSVHALV